MTDTSLTDMASFFERYDHRNRLVFVAAISASLVMSAVIFAHGQPTIGAAPAKSAAMVWWFAILFAPLLFVGWWTFGDVRNSVRIADAGFVFNLALTATVIMQQALWMPFVFGYRVAIGEWIAHATMLAVGAVTI